MVRDECAVCIDSAVLLLVVPGRAVAQTGRVRRAPRPSPPHTDTDSFSRDYHMNVHK